MKRARIWGPAAGAAALLLVTGAQMALAQNLIDSNTTIHDSLCVGYDCVTTEAYGFDTIRLKENNLRIHFDDTSTLAGYPTTNWRIAVNSASSGGNGYFAIQDADAGANIVMIEANAPANALRIDDYGRVGLGTGTPYVEVHVSDGDTPTLRLDQNGSGGWAPQAWDVAGNETNFFVRDVTTGSRLPLRIFPGADTNSLTISADSNIGIGIGHANAALHVQRIDGTAKALIEEISSTAEPRQLLHLKNNGIVWLTLEDSSRAEADYSGRAWNFQNQGGEFRVTTPPGGTGEIEMRMTPTGDMYLKGQLYTGGSCASGCDRVFDAEYALPSIPEQMAAIAAEGHLPNVGPTGETGPFNLSAMSTGMLNELEKAHLYIGQLHARNEALEARVDAQEVALKALSARIGGDQ